MSDSTQAGDDDPGWAGFYAALRGRAPRVPFMDAVLMAETRLGGPGVAADVGCGDGVEARALLARGWQVHAIDSEPASATFVREDVEAAGLPRLFVQTAAYTEMQLPPVDLLWAGMSLPFCAPTDFADAWRRMMASLRGGGCFAGHFFGPKDSWAQGDGGLTIHDGPAIRALLQGFEITVFNECEWDGPSGSGPKHWHLFDVVAFRP